MIGLNKILAYFSATPSNAGLFPLKLYFYKEFLSLKGTTASLRNCRRIIWTKY